MNLMRTDRYMQNDPRKTETVWDNRLPFQRPPHCSRVVRPALCCLYMLELFLLEWLDECLYLSTINMKKINEFTKQEKLMLLHTCKNISFSCLFMSVLQSL